MPKPIRPTRLNLTGPILAYALMDIFGLACIVIGGSWFVAGKGAFITGFPGSMAEAVACAAGGAVVLLWSADHLRREIGKQTHDTQ